MSTCISSLADANIAMVTGATITLCENTIYSVGAPLDSTFSSFPGGLPLIVDVADVTIQCGISGASSGNCTMEGGFAQLLLGSPSDVTSTSNNLKVNGLTFTGIMESALSGTSAPRPVVATNSGTGIVFNDCIFKDIQSTGYVVYVAPDALIGMQLTIQNSVFSNIGFSFDAIYADADSQVSLENVTFANMTHLLPEDDVDKCADLTAATCDYTSSLIHFQSPFSILTNIAVSDSIFYTAILETSFEYIIDTATPLIEVSNTSIYNEEDRIANEDYCVGGYAADFDVTFNNWYCRRLTAVHDVYELLKCGIDCNQFDTFTTFISLLEATDLYDSIADMKNITVFAPTDFAFTRLPDGYLDRLVANDTTTLKEILQYHFTSEDPIHTEAISFGLPAAETLQGESVSFTPQKDTSGVHMVDGASIIVSDWEESPGTGNIVQVIDNVLFPSTVVIDPSLIELLEVLELTGILNAALSIGYEPEFNISKTYTFFAPSNEAFANSTLVQGLLNVTGKTQAQRGEDIEQLEQIFMHHFLEGNYSMEDFQDVAAFCWEQPSLAGKNIKFTTVGFNLTLNDDTLNETRVDVQAHHGVLHVIDGVLDPNEISSCFNIAGAVGISLSTALLATSVLGVTFALLV
ncbi:unnamed protein product [Cylindrotheca closterium]|uniref:FAS1 domain-containing protein n=1 Tax=Cylindrotheca closterium TaxID=2856 RepID=A0AAD2CK84_9STRA|nr:unnamed protein product [Cylindrotheca closterium]